MIAPILAAALLIGQDTDRCRAPITGYRPGQEFSGTVRYVIDGDGVCVSDSADQTTWVEVRLADFYAIELHAPGGQKEKRAMESIGFGRRANCTITRGANGRWVSFDRVIAICRIDGVSLGDSMRALGQPEGGRGIR